MWTALKQAESPYSYLHERLGLAHLAAERRDLALAGRISYGEWLSRDVALVAGPAGQPPGYAPGRQPLPSRCG